MIEANALPLSQTANVIMVISHAVMVEQDFTLRNGGKSDIRTTRTTAPWSSWKKPFEDTLLLTLFHAAFPPLRASLARYINRCMFITDFGKTGVRPKV